MQRPRRALRALPAAPGVLRFPVRRACAGGARAGAQQGSHPNLKPLDTPSCAARDLAAESPDSPSPLPLRRRLEAKPAAFLTPRSGLGSAADAGTSAIELS